MRYDTINGDEISAIGMGCYALSGAYGSVDHHKYRKVIDRAIELGVVLFDTADTYGEDAERVLGEALVDVREDVFISTKVGITEGKKPDLSYDSVVDACKNSLSRLKTNYIDFYLIHFDDPETPVEETVEALEHLQDEQMILHYGVSHIPHQRVEEYIELGDPSILMFEYSAVARDAESRLFPLCRKHDLAGLAFSVTGRGVLTGKITPETEFGEGDIRNNDPLFKYARFGSALRIARKMEEIGKKHDKTPVQMAIAWVLSHPEITCALTGPSSIEHLEENVQGAEFTIPDEDMEELEQFLKQDHQRMLEDESELLKKLLKEPLDQKSGVSDLVYVFETAISRGWAEETDLMPLFMRLWKMKEDPDSAVMEEIQSVLKEGLLDNI